MRAARRTHQEGLVELEGAGELPLQLVDTVQPLQEDRATLVQVLRVLSVSTPVCELMAKVQPLGLHQNLEALSEDVITSGSNGAARLNLHDSRWFSFIMLDVCGQCCSSVPLWCGSTGPAAAWPEPRSVACGPSRPSSAPGRACGHGPRRGPPAALPSAAGTGAAATWCSPEQRASWRHRRNNINKHITWIVSTG